MSHAIRQPQAIRKDPAQIMLERAIRRAVERQQQLRAERRRWWLDRIGEAATVLMGVVLFLAFWFLTP